MIFSLRVLKGTTVTQLWENISYQDLLEKVKKLKTKGVEEKRWVVNDNVYVDLHTC